MTPSKTNLKLELALLLALATVWGASYTFIKLGVATIPPVTLIAARTLIAGGILLALIGCARRGGPVLAAPAAPAVVVADPAPVGAIPVAVEAPYTLDSGDKLRIVVFGQEGLTSTYAVDAAGFVTMPLIGAVPARGSTTADLARAISAKLKNGYIREPHVAVEVETYRPFFILGEVTTPGQYAYVPNMTAEKAIAIAGGFSARANKSKVELTRSGGGQQIHGDVPLSYPLRPGDTVVVKERWF